MPPSSFGKNYQQYAPTDSAQFSNQDLGRAYWIVTHKTILRNIAIAFLLAVDVLLVGYAVFGFANYVLIGNSKERDAVAAISTSLVADTTERLKKSAPQPLVFGEALIFLGSDERSDLVAAIENPNELWYATVTYSFTVEGEPAVPARTVIILPQEKKYLTELSRVFTGGVPAAAALTIVSYEWHRIDPHEIPDVRAFMEERHNFEITNAQFLPAGLADSGVALSGNKILFTITNKTSFNFYELPVQVALLQSGSLVGLEETVVRNLKTGEARAVDLRSYAQISVDEVQVIPSVNVLDREAYSAQ